MGLLLILCGGNALADNKASTRAEQDKLRQELEQLAQEHARSVGARKEEESSLERLLAKQAVEQRALRRVRQQVREAENGLQDIQQQVTASEKRIRSVLQRLQSLAAIHTQARNRTPTAGDAMESARQQAWLRQLGRQRAELLTELDMQTRSQKQLLAEQQSTRESLAKQQSDVEQRIARLDRIAREHRTTISALQQQERRDQQRQQTLQKRLGELDRLMDQLSRRAVSPQKGLGPIKNRHDWPIAGEVLERFGSRGPGVSGPRRGTLQAVAPGTEIPAVHDGMVAWVGWLPQLGLSMLVDHGQDYYSLYAHADTVLYGVGDMVLGGTPILLSGQTGSPPRPAIYLELRKGRKPLNPRAWFRSAP